MPRRADLPEAVAARAARLARNADMALAPRPALQRAVAAAERHARASASASGGGGAPPSPGQPQFAVPPGTTAVFVPLDALPDAPPGAHREDVVAFFLPEGELEEGVGGGGGGGSSAPPAQPERPAAQPVSQATAALLAELEDFASSAPAPARWRALV